MEFTRRVYDFLEQNSLRSIFTNEYHASCMDGSADADWENILNNSENLDGCVQLQPKQRIEYREILEAFEEAEDFQIDYDDGLFTCKVEIAVRHISATGMTKIISFVEGAIDEYLEKILNTFEHEVFVRYLYTLDGENAFDYFEIEIQIQGYD